MHRLGTACLVALAAAVGIAALVGAAWAVDTRIHDGQVARNTILAGRQVGGMSADRLAAVVTSVAEEYRREPIVVEAPGGGFTTAASDLGVTVDSAGTRLGAHDLGRTGPVRDRITGWLRSLVTHRRAVVRVRIDEPAVRRVVAAKDPGPRTAPIEPLLRAKTGGTGFVVIDGKPGNGIDPGDVIEALPKAATAAGPVRVKVGRGEVRPRFTKADAQRLQKEAARTTGHSLLVTAGTATATVPSGTLRTWVRSEPADDGLRLGIDPKRSTADLARLLAAAATPATQTSFTVVGGVPVASAGSPGSACCGDGAAARIATALFDDQPDTTPLVLPLKVVQPTVSSAQIASLGVNELVSTFTTNYPTGQPRVTNIHRIADIVKGTLIMPGETFSLNGRVGQRTALKGFVVDHEINDDGSFDEAVGGGISQFATTTFNAAFFAGLDYGEYQSHTLYISRYPYGREATVSWQHPDLQIRNTSPYGVVIWATYTPSSLTVSLYSTKFMAAVTQSAQTTAPFGPGCTRVTTERTRDYLDGRSVIDHVIATYQPAEGKKCR